MNIEEHNTPVVDNAISETLKELLEIIKTKPIEKDRLGFLLNYFIDRRITQLLKYQVMDKSDQNPNRSNYENEGLSEKIEKNSADLRSDEMVRALQNKKTYRQTYYRKAYEGLRDTEIHKGWSDILTEIYDEDKALNEIFVRLVEEREGVTITTAKALQEITCIYRLGFDKNFEKEEARSQLEHVFNYAMKYRYERALEEMLDGGGKYSDLVKTDPTKFYLPDNIKEDAIEEAIYNSFELGDTSAMKPALMEIAKATGVPYEIVLRSSQRHKD
jgi:hypothetical protein